MSARGRRRRWQAAKGECFYYAQNLYKIGIKLHLFTIIPAAVLVCFQFVPRIRHCFILFHRINGYIILVLVPIGLVGALMILRRAFGGGLDTQVYGGVVAIISAVSLTLAYTNIKKLQIEEHRKWMLRAWAYLGTIITMRFIFVIMAIIVTKYGNYYQVRECSQARYIIKDEQLFAKEYPQCISTTSPLSSGGMTLVHANLTSDRSEEMAAALGVCFGPAAWLALVIHAVLVELYLHLTPAEHNRLHNISHQRQLEAGALRPGDAGLTAQRLGDANP